MNEPQDYMETKHRLLATALHSSQLHANDIAYNSMSILLLPQIHDQVGRLRNLINSLAQLRSLAPHTPYPEFYFQLIDRYTRYAISQLIIVSNAITELVLPRTRESLAAKEKLFLIIISLFIEMRHFEAAVITMERIIAMFFKLVLSDNRFKTRELVTKLYDYVRETLKLSMPDRTPVSLPITDIFEMYAKFIHTETPAIALNIYCIALQYSEQGYCRFPSSHFYCLKGIAACHAKLADRRYGHITDENEDVELDACFQLGVNYLLKALDYRHQNALDKIDIHNCLHMLTILYQQLGMHYEHLYKKTKDSSLISHIEHGIRMRLSGHKKQVTLEKKPLFIIS